MVIILYGIWSVKINKMVKRKCSVCVKCSIDASAVLYQSLYHIFNSYVEINVQIQIKSL